MSTDNTSGNSAVNKFFFVQAFIVTALAFIGVATDLLAITSKEMNYVWGAFAYVYLTPFFYCAYIEFKALFANKAVEVVQETGKVLRKTQMDMKIDMNISKSEENFVL